MRTKPLTVEQWQEEIARGLEYRRRYAAEEYWAELEALFYAVHDSQAGAGPNLMIATGDALLSTLTVPFPVYGVQPLSPESSPLAPVREAIYNHLVTEIGMPSAVENMALAAYLYGVGIGKVGFDSQYGWAPEHDIGVPGDEAGATMTQFDEAERRIEYGGNGPGQPWFESVLPHDFVVPYGTKTLDTARWAAHRVVRHIDEVKADPKYTGTKRLQPTMSMKDVVESYLVTRPSYRLGSPIRTQRTTGDKPEYIELWEIHDRHTGKMLVIATDHDEFLRDEVDGTMPDGRLPFVDLAFVPRVRSFWTTSDAFLLRPHQAELADIYLQGQKQRRSGVAKMIAQGDAFEQAEIDKLTSADVGVVVTTKPGVSLAQAITTLQPFNNSLLYQDAEFTRRASREMVGFSSNQFGEFDRSSRRSATEARIVADASNLRMDRRQTAVRDVYIKAMHRIGALIEQYWTLPQVIPYVGPDGAEKWATFTGPDLAGKYKCSLSFTSEPPPSPSQKKNQAVAKAQTLLQMGADPAAVGRYLVEQIGDQALIASLGQQTPQTQQQGVPYAPTGMGMGGGSTGPADSGAEGNPGPGRPPL